MPLVWCKNCSKHKDKISSDPSLTGKAQEDALKYSQKVTFVKNSNAGRHLASTAHKMNNSSLGLAINK